MSVGENAPAPGPAGYWPSPWPGEDGGPRRTQAPHGSEGIRLGTGARLTVTSRDAFAATMIILRDPDEVFVLRHTMGPRIETDPVTAWVERVDPLTLEPVGRSPVLEAGPFWPGGMAAHANGSIYVVCGNSCHRLSPSLDVLGSRRLPRPRPYNSFVILDDGVLVMKDLDRERRSPALLTVLDSSLEPVCADVEVPESSIARLSADGDTLYVVGDHTICRYRWDRTARRLERDRDWEHRYRTLTGQSYGWDVVLEGGHAWFMDNGEHDYLTTMTGAGVAKGPIHLFRVSLADATDVARVEVSGLPHGSCTNPPLYDPVRRIALGYDSGNGVIAAWRLVDGGALAPLWRREIATAGHLLRFAESGQVMAYDFRGATPPRSPRLRTLLRKSSGLVTRPWFRRLATRGSREDVVLLDLESGAERARASVPSLFQSVLFPAPGWNRDLYYCSFSTIARITVG